MRAVEEFLNEIKNERDRKFKNLIKEWDLNWHIKIVEKQPIFIYISKDKKNVEFTSPTFDPNKLFSYIIYFSWVKEVAHFISGSVKYIGTYDIELKRVDRIPLDKFDLIGGSNPASSFSYNNNPICPLNILHKDGNKYHFEVCPLNLESLQDALNKMWEIEKFYSSLSEKEISPTLYMSETEKEEMKLNY